MEPNLAALMLVAPMTRIWSLGRRQLRAISFITPRCLVRSPMLMDRKTSIIVVESVR
ncbi:hypothetical protein TIFTF001_030738 [Ficus carica]|uniref:Uncharacterized protein n=1 Tax=Ficus carica TaxID=3494 RepID=A0AA88J4J5_FICCA|nr:hypothetical protein TIFTF001_030738 [Ficus carica]